MKMLNNYIQEYQNTGELNDNFHQQFTAATDTIPILKEHRDYIEKNKLGFGDRAFHYMWYLILEELKKNFSRVNMLEIGVYKGQVISLWSLLSKRMGLLSTINAITPLSGNIPKNRLAGNRYVLKLKALFSSRFRKCLAEGNQYPIEDYESIVRSLFKRFEQNFDDIKIYRGYSTNPEIVTAVKNEKFNLIYIDGDHSYQGVVNDLNNYAPLVVDGGYLVMDDASWFLEGSVFWKGHKEVSRACDKIEEMGFKNILNVGHNRIYKKQ